MAAENNKKQKIKKKISLSVMISFINIIKLY